MELRGKHILLISPDPWEGLKASKHHLAQALGERGNEVVFWGLSERDASRPQVVGDGPVKHVRYHHWFKGINGWPKPVHRWYYERTIEALERSAGKRFDIIWCFDTSRMQWFPGDGRLGILHLVDLDILHQGANLMRTADVVFTTTQPIVDKVLSEAPGARVHKVGHALSGEWSKGMDALFVPRGHAPRTAAYAGLLATDYVDWVAMRTIITEHSDMEFHLYGPFEEGWPSEDFRAVRRLPNARWHGLVPKGELIPALRAADLLFFFYRSDVLLEQLAYPHKMLEYLSTGDPVVCSRTLEFEGRTDLVSMAMDRSSSAEVFRNARANFAAEDTTDKRTYRARFASESGMDRFIDRLELLLP